MCSVLPAPSFVLLAASDMNYKINGLSPTLSKSHGWK